MQNLCELKPDEYELSRELLSSREIVHELPDRGWQPELEAEINKNLSVRSVDAQKLYLLKHARLLGEKHAHATITCRDRVVLSEYEDWGQSPCNHPLFYTMRLPAAKKLDGIWFSLYSRWLGNYWHWLFDVVGKLILLKDMSIEGFPKIDRLIGYGLSKQRYKKESLEWLGYTNEQIMDVEGEGHYECEKLLVADRPCANPYPEFFLIKALRDQFLAKVGQTDKPKKIYISRGQSTSRRLRNEEEFTRVVSDFGFERFYLEEMSFFEQVALFHGADQILAQHGAGLTNLVFSKPGAKVLEIFEPEFINPCYAWISKKIGLDYSPLINGDPKKAMPTFWWNNIPKELDIDCQNFLKMFVLAPFVLAHWSRTLSIFYISFCNYEQTQKNYK